MVQEIFAQKKAEKGRFLMNHYLPFSISFALVSKMQCSFLNTASPENRYLKYYSF